MIPNEGSQKFWLDGLAFAGVPMVSGSLDVGTEKYWLDGKTSSTLTEDGAVISVGVLPTIDAVKNFSYSTIVTPPSPALSGVSGVVGTGEGADFPVPPFDAVVWPAGALPRRVNAEVVRVTAIAGDTLTWTRLKESSSARTIVAGDQIAAAITAKILTDMTSGGIGVAGQTANDLIYAASATLFARIPGASSAVLVTSASGVPFLSATLPAAVQAAIVAGKATVLATPQAINGVNFDGSAPITVTAAAGTLTGTTLAAGVTTSSLTSVGILSSLTVVATINGSVSGSAATLTTPRAINGVNFDGSAAITVPAAAGTLTGTLLDATLSANIPRLAATATTFTGFLTGAGVGSTVGLVVAGSVFTVGGANKFNIGISSGQVWLTAFGPSPGATNRGSYSFNVADDTGASSLLGALTIAATGAVAILGTLAWGGGATIASSTNVPLLASQNIFTVQQQVLTVGTTVGVAGNRPLALAGSDSATSDIVASFYSNVTGHASVLHFSDAFTYNLGIGTDTSGAFTVWAARFPTATGTAVFKVFQSGGVAVGSTTDPGAGVTASSYFLASTGFFMATWPTTASAANAHIASGDLLRIVTSLRAAKHDITEISTEEAVRVVNGLRGVLYRSRVDKDQRQWPGFIAEDVEVVTPTLAMYGAKGMLQSVAYGREGAYLVPAFQDLYRRVLALEVARG